jgi:ABC-type antimicrobial peptide transport system permease subunit
MTTQSAVSPNASPDVAAIGIGIVVIVGIVVLYDVVSEILSHVFVKRSEL